MKHLITHPTQRFAKFFALLLLLLACTAPAKAQDIIGGSPIDITQAPWQVSLEINGTHQCGGTILNALWVLTAAHCLEGASSIIVHAGTTDQTNNAIGQRVAVAATIIHPNYLPEGPTNPATNDMALLRLALPLCLNEGVQPVSYATPQNISEPAIGTPVFVTGWGNTGNGCCSAILMGATIPVIDRTEASSLLNDPLNNQCNINMPNLVTEVMLPLFAPGVAVAQGDSGGPAVINSGSAHPILVGVSSWGGCPRDEFPSVEANVQVLADFITTHITYEVPPCSCPDADIHIWENTVYDKDMDMPGDIIVHGKAELTIKSKIGMRQGHKILVERNARLVVGTGGVLTRGCGAPDWAGVQVIGSPNRPQPAHDALLNTPSQAGIVRLDNCKVEWAQKGIWAGSSTSGSNGGMVWAKGSTGKVIFSNNKQGVVFGPYSHSANKSRFSNVTFEESGNAFADTEGVKIEGTDGIEFDNCTFINMDFEGIRNIDAAIKVVNNNTFEGNDFGISALATIPVTQPIEIGASGQSENTFTNNYVHISASVMAGGVMGQYAAGKFHTLNIINNNFTGGYVGAFVDGPSTFTMAGNLVQGANLGAVTFNTGYNSLMGQNLIGCNNFKQINLTGILAMGGNQRMQFLANNFETATGGQDFFVGSLLWLPIAGSINPVQGSLLSPAENCFTDPGFQDDISTWGITEPFTYYYEGGDPPANCKPEPLTPGNYTKVDVQVSLEPIDCSQFGGLPPGAQNPTAGDLDARRDTLQQLFPSIGTSASARNTYYRILAEKDAILRYLVDQAWQTEQFAVAEALIAGEQSKAADWAILGLRMLRRDYVSALSWLNQLPIENTEDAWFRGVQQINIQRLQNDSTFELSAAQDSFLTAVAESRSPVRGYARGMLSILKDRRYYPDLQEVIEARRLPPAAQKSALREALQVSPVPTSSSLSVSWPTLPKDADAHLLVFDILGKPLADEPLSPFESQRALQLEHLPTGVYFLLLTDKGRPMYRTKFMIQR
jgi:trypsin